MHQRVLVAALVAVCAFPAHADVDIGGFARTEPSQASLRIFDPATQGNGAAAFDSGGPASGLVDSQWAVCEPIKRVLHAFERIDAATPHLGRV